jgi:3-oxoacyl-[acyl-carrier protein] reductase
MDLGIRGRTAIVASVARVLGMATAVELAREGVRLVVADADGGALETARSRLKGAEICTVVADLTTPEGAARMVAEAVSAFGSVDVVVLDPPAPPRLSGALADFGDDDLREAHRRLNMGLVYLAREAVPHMRAAGWGRIVAFAASNLSELEPGAPNYAGGLQVGMAGVAKTLAHEFGRDGVIVNVVSPGPLDGEEGPLSGALRRRGRPDEIAAVAAFLCSERAAYLTGETIRVNGGLGEFIF